ncbi:MAG TPA: hypothetical protein PLJ47_01685 [Candidatus Hydrogenedentes bacterium]|nr:hypothetical protein [Candidatus Hydrogenedentota bacterium]HRK33277.1 hypothetical protein [Candidatus Hydrogenedentota bacterium]
MRLASRVGAFEVTAGELRLAVMNTGGALPTLVEYHAATLAYGSEEERASAVGAAAKRLLALAKSKPSLYVLCLNSQSTVVRTLTVPFKGRARVSATVPVELEPSLAFPIDDLIIDHSVIREGSGETEVLAVAVKHVMVEQLLGAFTDAGIEIEGVSIDAAGLATLWLAGQRKPAGLHAQLHVREASALLTVVHNKSLVYFRHLPVTASRFQSNPGAASRETRNTLRAFATTWHSEDVIADLTVTGAELDETAREAFEAELSVPVLYVNLGEHVRGVDKALAKFRSDLEKAPPETAPSALLDHNTWEAAAGVALASAGGGIAFELRRGSLAPKNPLRGMANRLAGTAALALVALAGAVGYCAAQYRNNMAEMESIGSQIWGIYAETFPDSETTERPADDLGGSLSMALLDEAYAKAMDADTQVSPETLARPPFLEILREVAEKLPDSKVRVTELKVLGRQGTEQTLTILGEVLDQNGFNEAFENLKSSTLIKVDGEPTRQTKDNRTTFAITATI